MELEEEKMLSKEKEKKISNRYCSVPQCRSRKTKDISLHFFPRNSVLKVKWAEVLKIVKPISPFMYVCSLHFKKEDFILPGFPTKKKFLKKNAIPSQNLPNESNNNKKSKDTKIEKGIQQNKKNTYRSDASRKCSVPGCNTNYKGGPTLSTFRFPKDIKLKRIWERQMQKENFRAKSNSYVCIKHFSREFLITEEKFRCDDGSFIVVEKEKPRLKHSAYPTIFGDITLHLKESSQHTTFNGNKKEKPRKVKQKKKKSKKSSKSQSNNVNNNTINEDSAVVLINPGENVDNDSTKIQITTDEDLAIKLYEEEVVALEEFYYARKNPNQKLIKAEHKGNFQFKCLVCKKIVENNVKVMKHINAHIDIQRQCKPALSDLTQCKYCFRDFETPFNMQCHMESVHLKNNSLVCRICSQEFSQFKNLSLHMKSLHVQCEMPYSCQLCHFRSSFHQDVITHFNETHYGTDKMLCHYCLKIFHIKFSNVGLGFIQNYFYHLHKHQLKSVTRKCSKCCLIFLSVQELKEHRLCDHKFLTNRKGIHSIKSSFVASFKEQLEEKSSQIHSSNLLTNTNYELTSDKSIKQLNGKIAVSNMEHPNKPSYKCCECGRPMALGHFGGFLICGCCPYSTNCHKAFVDHMIYKHTKLHTSGKNMAMDLKPVILKYPMKCKCGFSSFEGNSIANHLVNCKKITCQITPSTKCMITVIKKSVDQFRYFDKAAKDTNFSQSLLTVIKTEKTQTTKKSIENMDYGEENPDMLNALGLVRRSMYNISDSAGNYGDIFNDTKSESLYFEVEVEEIDPSVHLCEEIEGIDD